VRITLNLAQQRQQQLKEWLNSASPYHCEKLDIVSGDASFRRYFRFADEGKSLIAVDAPPEFENSKTFALVANSYKQHGVSVPEIYAIDHNLGFYCLEDFGDDLFADALNSTSCHTLYTAALASLSNIQTCMSTDNGSLPRFDEALLAREFELFSHWLLEVHLDLQLSSEEKSLIEETFVYLQDAFLSQPQVGVHRDYHSRNLMLIEDERIGIIDFQDAVIGPITYDAASLLRDCYQSWPAALTYTWLKDWHTKYHSQYVWTEFKRWFDLTGMQRHIKASGIFARLCHRDGKKSYLQDIPHTLQYLCEVGSQYEQCREFSKLVESKIKPAVELALK
jgi:aminoglycoside/choline kinase family phosphotransferase